MGLALVSGGMTTGEPGREGATAGERGLRGPVSVGAIEGVTVMGGSGVAEVVVVIVMGALGEGTEMAVFGQEIVTEDSGIEEAIGTADTVVIARRGKRWCAYTSGLFCHCNLVYNYRSI